MSIIIANRKSLRKVARKHTPTLENMSYHDLDLSAEQINRADLIVYIAGPDCKILKNRDGDTNVIVDVEDIEDAVRHALREL